MLLPRSAVLVVAVLAAAKPGGVYLPLDVRAPAERMQRVLAEAGASVVLTDSDWRPWPAPLTTATWWWWKSWAGPCR